MENNILDLIRMFINEAIPYDKNSNTNIVIEAPGYFIKKINQAIKEDIINTGFVTVDYLNKWGDAGFLICSCPFGKTLKFKEADKFKMYEE